MIEVHGLKKHFVTGSVVTKVLHGIDLSVGSGEFLAIMGRSGAGKSTLMYQISLLDVPTAGTIIIDGIDTSTLNRKERTNFRLKRLGYVFQDYALLPELNAIENVALPMIMQGMSKKDAFSRAQKALDKIGVGDKRSSLPSQLSGGQQQRVSIARAIAHGPHVLFADEPTANLDSVNSHLVLEALVDLHKEGQTIVMVTHEEEYAKKALRILSLKDGKIISDQRK